MKSLAVCCLLAVLALPTMALEANLVKDIIPGPESSNPEHLVTFDDAVLFFAAGGLWRTDGTAEGTLQLAPSGTGRSFRLTEHLYFYLVGLENLWVSDGTPGGTFPLHGFDVRTQFQNNAIQSVWIASEGVLYFLARDEHGTELWRSDGTAAGTRLVKDVRPGPDDSNIEWLAEYKGELWFAADDGQRGGALWRSDGTAAGTVLVVDPVPSSSTNGAPEQLRVVQGHLTFFAPTAASPDKQLWTSDGTAGGTRPITTLSQSRGQYTLYNSVVHEDRLFFIAQDRKGQELWISDGTRRGTKALTRFPYEEAFHLDHLWPQQDLPGRFVFWANDGIHGVEPWITDGSRQGTRLLRDTCPGTCDGWGFPWYTIRGRLIFSAGNQVWATNGRKSTRLLRDDSFSYAPFVVGNRLFFVSRDDQNGEEVWVTNGTKEGTIRVTDFEQRFIWEEKGFHGAVLNGQLLFGAADAEHGMELWAITP